MLTDHQIEAGFSQATVLLADDSAFMLELITAMLKAFGIKEIDKANDGEKALEMIQERPYNLVIADWLMRPMDGLAFLRHIRRETKGPAQRISVIMCTAHTDKKRVLMLRDAGANEILTKPVSPASVYGKVVSAMFHPRPFVVSEDYVGPDRRRRQIDIDFPDRRTKNLAQRAPSDQDMFL